VNEEELSGSAGGSSVELLFFFRNANWGYVSWVEIVLFVEL
jgi:hypothetical protein